MSKRKRNQRAASGEPRQPMNQRQGNRPRRPSNNRRQASTPALTERERVLLDLYKIQREGEKQITEMYSTAADELINAKRFLSVLGLLPMYESFVNPSTAADEIAYCQEAVFDIVNKIATSR